LRPGLFFLATFAAPADVVSRLRQRDEQLCCGLGKTHLAARRLKTAEQVQACDFPGILKTHANHPEMSFVPLCAVRRMAFNMIYRNAWRVNHGPGATVMEVAMQIEASRSAVNLAGDGLIAIRDSAGTRVFCQSGTLWVTQEGQIKDAVLGPGDMLTIRNRGLTLITALQTSAVALLEQQSRASEDAASQSRAITRSGTEPVACN
jgi:hypothetical protein